EAVLRAAVLRALDHNGDAGWDRADIDALRRQLGSAHATSSSPSPAGTTTTTPPSSSSSSASPSSGKPPAGPPGGLRFATDAEAAAYNAAVDRYRARDFDGARAGLGDLAQRYPEAASLQVLACDLRFRLTRAARLDGKPATAPLSPLEAEAVRASERVCRVA